MADSVTDYFVNIDSCVLALFLETHCCKSSIRISSSVTFCLELSQPLDNCDTNQMGQLERGHATGIC